MYNTSRELYTSLKEYLSELVNDKMVAIKLIEVFIKADIPLQIFATTVKLYKTILLRRELPREHELAFTSNNLCLKSKMPGTNTLSHKTQEIDSPSRPISTQAVPHAEILRLLNDSYISIIACCIISCKYYRDVAFTNDSWEQVTSIDMHTLNNAERLSLILLDYEINSSGDSQIIERIRGILQGKSVYINEYNQNSKKKVKVFVKRMFCLS